MSGRDINSGQPLGKFLNCCTETLSSNLKIIFKQEIYYKEHNALIIGSRQG